MGAFRTGSYEVTPPGRSRACDTARQADRSRQGQQVRVSLTESQTQRAGPSTSSLSYGGLGTALRGRSPYARLDALAWRGRAVHTVAVNLRHELVAA